MFHRKLACSFCGKRDFEVEKLVAGPRVYICDKCVALASQIMQSSSGEGQSRRRPAGSVIQRAWARLRQMMSRRHAPHGSEFRAVSRHAYEPL